MGAFSIAMKGICTHFSQQFHENLPVPHRVVLVNGHRSDVLIQNIGVAPHIASITMDGRTFLLGGVSIGIKNGTTPFKVSEDFYLTIPVLSDLAIMPMPAARNSVFLGAVPTLASAYLDITTGTLTACLDPIGAAVSKLIVETDGDPVMTFQPFLGTFLPDGLQPEMPVSDGSAVVLENSSSDDQFPMTHFLLHYLTASEIPDAPQVPRNLKGPPCPVSYAIVGGGCSNSSYP